MHLASGGAFWDELRSGAPASNRTRRCAAFGTLRRAGSNRRVAGDAPGHAPEAIRQLFRGHVLADSLGLSGRRGSVAGPAPDGAIRAYARPGRGARSPGFPADGSLLRAISADQF